jgi:hypothetical protein
MGKSITFYYYTIGYYIIVPFISLIFKKYSNDLSFKISNTI